MEEEHIVSQITKRGIIIANRLRIVMVVLFGILVTAGSSTNPMIINIAFFSTLAVFFILSLLNYATATRGREYLWLKYLTVVIEISTASILKTSHAFLGNYPQVVNESVVFSIYWIFILLSFLQNRTRLSVFAGTLATVEYAALILISIFVWKVPVILGNELPGYLVLDNEIAKVLLLIGFTWTGTLILRNLNGFALEAYDNGKTALKRTEYLEEMISRATSTNADLEKVSSKQRRIFDSFSRLAAEQAALSEEFSSVYEEQYASIDSISRSADEQKRGTDTTLGMMRMLKESQKNVAELSAQVLGDNALIGDSSRNATGSLERMIEKMGVISEGGRSITNFIAVISDITDKINLLSLNAAIEAARAGEHGRGFAVVADEIGKLATATADNSKEISEELVRISSDIEGGMDIVNSTKEAVESVARYVAGIREKLDAVRTAMARQGTAAADAESQVEKMDELAAIISNATGEQKISMEETSKSTQKLSQIAGEVVANNEEIINLSDTISARVEEMSGLIREIR